jgi:hypothetical protein
MLRVGLAERPGPLYIRPAARLNGQREGDEPQALDADAGETRRLAVPPMAWSRRPVSLLEEAQMRTTPPRRRW